MTSHPGEMVRNWAYWVSQCLSHELFPMWFSHFLFLLHSLVGVKVERMENKGRKIGWKTVFFTVLAKERKWRGRKTGRKFSLGYTIFILPNREENLGRKVLWKHFYPNTSPNIYNNPTRQNKKEAENNHQTQHHHQTPELSTEI